MKEIWVATSNKGKLSEFKMLLANVATVHSVSELGYYSAPPETGNTFEDNARIKAKSLSAVKKGVWVVADDSGLEVEGLGGLPGIHSARYAGEKASAAENNAKLLKMVQIRTPSQRQAQFRCVLIVYDPNGKEWKFEGLLKGQISTVARGTVGFGYDPVFIPEGHSQTLAELGLAVKNQISHRALAIRELSRMMQDAI